MRRILVVLLFCLLLCSCAEPEIVLTERQKAAIDLVVAQREAWQNISVKSIPSVDRVNRVYIFSSEGKIRLVCGYYSMKGSNASLDSQGKNKVLGEITYQAKGYLVDPETQTLKQYKTEFQPDINGWFSWGMEVNMRSISDAQLKAILTEAFKAGIRNK